MKNLEIKTVEQLANEYDNNNLQGWTSVDNIERKNSERFFKKQRFHEEKFKECSKGTQIALINDFIFDGFRYSIGRTNFTNPKCLQMLDEYLKSA